MHNMAERWNTPEGLLFKSERLSMKPLDRDDKAQADFFIELSTSEYFKKYESNIELDTPEMVEEYMLKVTNFPTPLWDLSYCGAWMVYAQDTVIGFVMCEKEPKEWYPTISYGVSEGETGKGYATEATRALLTWVRDNDLAEDFFAVVQPENEASKKVLKKSGFVVELGIHELKLFMDGKPGMAFCTTEVEDVEALNG
ncbi:acyl-CoA N-acyltransferase [Aulographum hederae CBS 113979]|uniref:Acyl-CoA N-acyltransferase n=1 Tax=Aulographum hederae CBS 113979 TaxID=1176131 RepID=A0A6G1GTY0_9PEZI|nr:acyl-CoA N-acyltransferase [Aulographum hederae CBS 113979]